MIYIIITSFVYLLLIMIIYFSKKRIDNYDTRIYTFILIVNLIGVMIDVLQFLMIKNNFSESSIIYINKIFLIYILFWTYLFASYILNLSIKNSFQKCLNIIKNIIMIFGSMLVLILPVEYMHDGDIIYTTGYATTMVFFGVSLFILEK